MFKRVKATLFGWNRQPSKTEVERMVGRYEAHTAEMPFGEAARLMGKALNDLIRISRYAESGEMKALTIAFALGYKAGKEA